MPSHLLRLMRPLPLGSLKAATSYFILLAFAGFGFAVGDARGDDDVTIELLLPRGSEPERDDTGDVINALLQELDAGAKWAEANFMAHVRGGSGFAGPTALDLAVALIRIEAPDPIVGHHSLDVNGRKSVRVTPVKDFDAFCDAIDYGRILERSDRKRYLKVRIERGELTEQNLKDRAEAAGREEEVSILDGEDGVLGPGGRGLGAESRERMKEFLGKNRGGAFSVGDQVEVSIGEEVFSASVVGHALGDAITVEITDMDALSKAVTSRRLSVRLSRMKSIKLTAPIAEVSPAGGAIGGGATGGGAASRTWNDASGRFSIDAAFVGVSDGKVTLKKEDGSTITVPLAKLSEADKQYVARQSEAGAPENPFASASTSRPTPEPERKRGKTLVVDRRRVKPFDSSGIDQWRFTPPDVSIQKAEVAGPSVDLADLPNSKKFFESIERLDVAADGSRVLIVRQKGHMQRDEPPFLQLVDTKSGRVTPLAQMTKKMAVLDSQPERGLLLTRRDVFGASSNERLIVQRMTPKGLVPVLEWVPYPEGQGRRRAETADRAWFLSGNRVLTATNSGRTCTIWKLGKKAVAEYEYEGEFSVPGIQIVVGPNRRMIALCSSGGVSIVDSQSGRVVGAVGSRDGKPMQFFGVGDRQQVAFRHDLQRLAVVRHGSLATWDMATGELVSELWHPAINFASEVLWAGEFALIDSEHLFDVDRRVLLWEYQRGNTGFGSESRVMASRLWYVPKARDDESTYLGSVAIPDPAAADMAESLGTPDSLLLARPGDRVSIRVDVDPRQAAEADVRSAITERLTAAGYIVVEDGAPLVAVAVCKALPKQEIKIDIGGRRSIGGSSKIVRKTITPYVSRVALELDGEEIWSESSSTNIWQRNIYLNDGETLDQALKRLTTPNIDRVLKATFASHVAKAGDVGRYKAYGESVLGR